MTAIPRTPSRWLALVGMVAVLPLAGMLATLAGMTDDVGWQLVSVVGGTAAIIAFVGLAVGMRVVALLGSALVTGGAFIVLLDVSSDVAIVKIPVLVAVAIGLTGCRAATVPTPDE